MNRRNFFTEGILFTLSFFGFKKLSALANPLNYKHYVNQTQPIILCTWNFQEAVKTSGEALNKGMDSLTSVVEGVSIEEANEKNSTVGKGAAPDRSGKVTLDGCVMNHQGDCGSVMAVENILHVALLARAVMEKTPHVYLAGKGAENFAYSQGFLKENLFTNQSKKKWEKWLKESQYSPEINIENHDTIGMLSLDQNGDMAGACSTSGVAYKMNGRVGDSPIIGSGLYVDNTVGAASATGLGEEVIKIVGSFLIVELMRNGLTPQKACEQAIDRIVSKHQQKPAFQVGFIAMNKNGEIGAYSIHKGFSYTYYLGGIVQNKPAKYYYQ